jgi:hypothetical protein
MNFTAVNEIYISNFTATAGGFPDVVKLLIKAGANSYEEDRV